MSECTKRGGDCELLECRYPLCKDDKERTELPLSERLLKCQSTQGDLPEDAVIREAAEALRVAQQSEDAPCEHRVLSCPCGARKYYPSAEHLAEQAESDLYDRVKRWRDDFLKKSRTPGHHSPTYYADAASGLAVALQEIDRERYDREA